MEIKEIVEELKYYTGELPKEALKSAIENKEKMIPELLNMLEYTKEHIEEIFNGEDEFYGYIYAFFLLAEFREKRAFPYLIDLISYGEEYIEYFIGDDYLEHLHRLLASTYNGDDNVLFSIIENNDIVELVRCCVLQTFAILYLNGEKDRTFIVDYLKKLIDNKKENDDSYLYCEILYEVSHLKLVELEKDIEKLYYLFVDEEKQELLNNLKDGEELNMDKYPLVSHYECIYDIIDIMEEWQCFRDNEDEEFENSDEYKGCMYTILNRINSFLSRANNIERNDLCYCGSGKKYKNCCMNKNEEYLLDRLNFIDKCICKAEWYVRREEEKKAVKYYRMAWFDVCDICEIYGIRSIKEYDQRFEGYNFFLNWFQEYDELLEKNDKKKVLYERLELWNMAEKTFDFNDEEQIYWKEMLSKVKADIESKLES